VLRKPIALLCANALQALGENHCALSVAFVDNRTIRDMNRRYRGRDYPTDVLSFGYGNDSDDGTPYLGDIVISLEIAFENAFRWHTSREAELRKILLHGILHLLGFDHETDSGEMNRLQNRLMRRKFCVNADPVLPEG
jgi:probable rRNA maturation factor